VSDFSQERLLSLLTKAPNAFWRFDVDVSLEAAAKMARFAQMAGVRGTFYVMLRGEFYNPFSRQGQRAVSELVGAGHRVGLHVDYRRYRGPTPPAFWSPAVITESVHQTVRHEKQLLNGSRLISLIDPASVSFHMPTSDVLWTDFSEFDSAYAPEWKGRYVSDSRREWSDEKEAQITDQHQVCLHPEHWFS
jgi:hypothetical protein